MIKKFILIGLVLLLGCKVKNSILLIKDTQIVDVPFDTTIKTFPWDNDFEGQRDSIFISNRGKKEIEDIIKKLDENDAFRHDIWNPRYAFILEYNSMKDTLYYDENFKEGFLVQNNIRIIDTTGILKKYLLKKHKQFLETEY